MEEKKLPLEKELEPIFLGKAPELPDNVKEPIVAYGPYLLAIGVIFGAIGLLGALGGGSALDRLSNALGGYSLGPMYYVSLAVLALQVVIGGMAIPKLLKREKAGWNMLYYYELIGVGYAVLSSFMYGFFSAASLVFSLLIAAVVFWIIFQIRSKYN
jgi:hypothetical protein